MNSRRLIFPPAETPGALTLSHSGATPVVHHSKERTQGTRGMSYSDASREPPSYHCGNGCSFYGFEAGEQIERCSYFFIVS